MAPKSRHPNYVKLPNHLCHTRARSLTQTGPRSRRSARPVPPTRNWNPEIGSRVWAISERQLEKSAQLSELTKRTPSSSGMKTVARDSTTVAQEDLGGPITVVCIRDFGPLEKPQCPTRTSSASTSPPTKTKTVRPSNLY